MKLLIFNLALICFCRSIMSCEKISSNDISCNLNDTILLGINYGIKESDFNRRMKKLGSINKAKNLNKILIEIGDKDEWFAIEPSFDKKYGLYKIELNSETTLYDDTLWELLNLRYGQKYSKDKRGELVFDGLTFNTSQSSGQFATQQVRIYAQVKGHSDTKILWKCKESYTLEVICQEKIVDEPNIHSCLEKLNEYGINEVESCVKSNSRQYFNEVEGHYKDGSNNFKKFTLIYEKIILLNQVMEKEKIESLEDDKKSKKNREIKLTNQANQF